MASVQKYLLFIFNLVFVLLGLAIIIIGALLHAKNQNFDILVDSDIPFFSVGTILIIVGVAVFIVAFAGCCGAIKESSFLLSIFIALLVLVLIVEVVVVVLGFLYSGEVETTLTDGLLGSLSQYNASYPNSTFAMTWDKIQEKGDCCGVNGQTDWYTNGTFASGMWPLSCNGADGMVYSSGCKDAIIGPIASNLLWAGVLALVVVLVEIVGISFACCLTKSIREKGETA